MASLPINFNVGSTDSSHSVRDAIASYRRAQYLAATSTVVSASEPLEYDEDNDVEDTYPIYEQVDEGDDLDPGDRGRTSEPGDEFLSQFEWDAEDGTSGHSREFIAPPLLHTHRERQLLSPSTTKWVDIAREDTPLLRKAVSFTAAPHPRRTSVSTTITDIPPIQPTGEQVPPSTLVLPMRRRSSASSSKSSRRSYNGRSTFGQTLFNSIAILLGIGMLSEPLAFAYSGWATGTVIIMSYGFISCYTAKILARIILADPRIRSYTDIGRKAFGPKSTSVISIMFCLELFAVSVILVTLYADSLHTIIPRYSTTTYKIWGSILLVPTVFLPLSLLSYTSILGIISSLMIILVILIDGFSKPDTPGSIWSPAETNVGVENWNNLGLAFGLFMAGFSGHAVIPSLARDMIDPTQFDRMINWAFVVATLLYALIGYAGYLMFGRFVSDEISMDLLKTPGYNPILNQAALWMLVISPLSKFALATQPLNATIEILLGIDLPLAAPQDLAAKSNESTTYPQRSHIFLKRFFAVLQRVTFTLLSILVSILVPEFSSTMAFLGSFSAFMLCVIGPISSKVVLAGRCGIFDGVVLFLGTAMAIWGTTAAFLAM